MQLNLKYLRKIIYLFFPVLAFSSCVYDELDEITKDGLVGGEKMYITIQVKSAEGLDTRALPEGSSYENGEEETEHPTSAKIQGAHAIFFDDLGNFMGMADMNPMKYENGGSHHEETSSDGIEAYYYSILEASKEKSEQPKKVLVVLNDSPVLDQINSKAHAGSTIENFKEIIWRDLQGGGNRVSRTFAGAATTADGKAYFTLSNASYLDANGNEHYEYEIPEGSFKESQKAAEDSPGVIVHVERMVSKFTPVFLGYTSDKLTYRPYDGNQLTIIKFDDNGEPTYEAQNWNMTVTGWGMNGIETENYLFKKIQNTSYYGWNAENGWNDTYQWRSYWGEDPHYKLNGEGIYPFQYRFAVEKNHDRNFKYYGDQANHGVFEDRSEDQIYDWALKYYSFNELNDNNRTGSATYSEHAYAPENTYAEGLSTSPDLDYENKRNNKIAGTHMLFCADLKVTDDGLSNFQPVGEHFYRDRIGICYTSDIDLFWGFVRAVNRKLESQGYMAYTFYNWDENNPDPIIPEPRYFEGTGKMKLYYDGTIIDYSFIKNLKVQGCRLSIPAPILHGDGKVFPWVIPDGEDIDNWLDLNKLEIRDEKGDEVTDTYYRKGFNPGTMAYDYEEVPGGFTVDDLASLFYEWCGAVDHYKYGKMYYAAPILHSAQDENGVADIYGNVRNHWYQLKINTVLNLGTPVDDLDQRIIPDNVYGKDNLKIDVEILPWHLVDFFVDLPGYVDHNTATKDNNYPDNNYKPSEDDNDD